VSGWQGSVLANLAPEQPMYFLHSFHAEPEHAQHLLADYYYDGVP